jgi:hypothetical protein
VNDGKFCVVSSLISVEAMKGTTAGMSFYERLSATLEGHKQWW